MSEKATQPTDTTPPTDKQSVIDPTAPASTGETKSSDGVVFALIFWGFMGGVFFFAGVQDPLYRVLFVVGVVGVALAVFIALSVKGRGMATWASFKRQMRLLAGLTLTILGAPAAAVMLANNDRMLALKLMVIVLLSFLPAALYWQFIAGKGRALWDEFVTNLYRLGVDHPVSLPKPPFESVFHAVWARWHANASNTDQKDGPTNMYQKKFEGVYGTMSDALTQRVLAENALPVVFATLFISLGWVLILQPEPVFDRTMWGIKVPATSNIDVPLREIGFAFLGAYFYSLQMLMRRYYQNDLKTSAYINVSIRIVIVVLLTWILSAVWKGDAAAAAAPWRYGVAFTIGVFPDVGWHLLQQLLKLPARWLDDSFRVRCPLSAIDGLNVWYQARLLEEGIEDMETLVTANLVDVMLHTRIPIDRLVDWIDQSVLQIHLAGEGEDGDASKSPSVIGARGLLAHLGIRKAMELLSVYNASDSTFRIEALRPKPGMPNDAIDVLVAVAETVRREPVLVNVIEWKNFPHHYLQMVESPEQVGRFVPPAAEAARKSLGVAPMGDVLAN